MPRVFLEQTLGAAPNSCVVLSVPHRIEAGRFGILTSDRIIVDTSVRSPFAQPFAVAAGDDRLLIVDGGEEDGRAFLTSALEGKGDLTLLGLVVGVVSVPR